jgi:ribosomal protein S30
MNKKGSTQTPKLTEKEQTQWHDRKQSRLKSQHQR